MHNVNYLQCVSRLFCIDNLHRIIAGCCFCDNESLFYAKGTMKVLVCFNFDSEFLSHTNSWHSAIRRVPSMSLIRWSWHHNQHGSHQFENWSFLEVRKLWRTAISVFSEFWKKIDATEGFHTFIKVHVFNLNRAILIIPLENGDVDSKFRILSDVMTKERSSMKPGTVVTKSC